MTQDEALSVTQADAIKFLESACRNWRRVPPLSTEDIGDVADALSWFLKTRLSHSTPSDAEVRKALDSLTSQVGHVLLGMACKADVSAAVDVLKVTYQDAIKALATPSGRAQGEVTCPASPTGRHIVDTSMESGPNNCFHCEAPMPRFAAPPAQDQKGVDHG